MPFYAVPRITQHSGMNKPTTRFARSDADHCAAAMGHVKQHALVE